MCGTHRDAFSAAAASLTPVCDPLLHLDSVCPLAAGENEMLASAGVEMQAFYLDPVVNRDIYASFSFNNPSERREARTHTHSYRWPKGQTITGEPRGGSNLRAEYLIVKGYFEAASLGG